MAENTIDNLSIQVVASAERAISTFNRLASGASGLKNAANGAAGGMQDMAQGARDAGTATQEAGTQAGSATISVGRFWNVLRSVGSRISGGFVQAVHRGTAAVGTFLKSIARIAFYRIIRSIIKDLGQSFRDLYGYSRLFGTDFAKSMDRITTASVYLRNSLAAMVAPLVNLFAPALDMLADKIVDILNFVNQLFAAINGQETYTVAKKVATTWESTFDSAADHANRRIKEVRNTLLGFDEINRLNGETPTTSGSTGSSPYTPGYSTMFEEKPLEGFFEKISNVTSGWPDWLKWLLGIGTVAIGAWGISKLPGLIGKIFDAFKNLFSITLPDWLRWLFGPKGDNDIGLDIPDKIDLPDADVPVNLKQGDWSVLQQIPAEKYLLLKVGVKMDGWLGNGNPQLPSNQPLVIDDDGSGTWDFTFQQAAMGANNLQAINNQLENMVDNWDDLAWEVAKMASGKVIDRTLRVAVKRSDSWDKTAWDAANMEDGVINRNVNVDIRLLRNANDLWKIFKEAWDKEDRTVGFLIKTASTANGHWDVFKKAWDKENRAVGFVIKTASSANGHWSVFKKEWSKEDRTVGFLIKTASTANGHWNTFKKEWDADDRKVGFIITTASSATGHWNVFKKEWDEENRAVGFIIKTASSANGHWDTFKKAWVAEDRKVGFIITTASSADGHWGVFKKAWVDGDRKVGFIITTASSADGHWDVFKKAWDAGDRMVYVDIQLKKKDWTTVTDFVDDSFGGATGGGGKTSGGGAGRTYGVDTKLNTPTDASLKDWWNATTTYWGKLLQAGGVAGMMVALKEPGEDGMQTLATKIGEAWDALLKANKLTYGVIIQPIANKTGDILSKMGNKISEWLFGKKTLSASVTVDGKPGDGFKGKLSGTNTYTLKGIEASDAKINATAGKGIDTFGRKNKLNSFGAQTVTVDTKAGNWSGGFLKWLTGNYWGDVNSTVYLKKGWNSSFLKWLTGDYWGDITATVNLVAGKVTGFAQAITSFFFGKADGGIVTADGRSLGFASGGSIMNNGRASWWGSVNKYAAGTSRAHGTLFVAGEAGPEVVGHVGGRTEVLNKSQLASAMFSAVQAAMAPAAANFASAAQSMGVADAGVDMETLAEMVRQGVEQAMARSNDYDRQKVALLQQINEKDYNPEISTSSINRAQQRMNRRAGTTIVPVGT